VQQVDAGLANRLLAQQPSPTARTHRRTFHPLHIEEAAAPASSVDRHGFRRHGFRRHPIERCHRLRATRSSADGNGEQVTVRVGAPRLESRTAATTAAARAKMREGSAPLPPSRKPNANDNFIDKNFNG